MIEMLKSKIHRARVSEANLNYSGSISISQELMEAASIYEFEKVLVVNINNGARFETYVIRAEEPGYICLNGAAARLAQEGDLIIIMSYILKDEKAASAWRPIVVKVDENNQVTAKI